MSMRSTPGLLLSLLCLLPRPLSAAPGAGPTSFSDSGDDAPTLPATTATNSSSTANCTDLSRQTGATHPTCWDALGMDTWMHIWNLTTKTCGGGEMWSTCFLRLAYGSPVYDCSTLGSLACVAPRLGGSVSDPRIFYGAYNIYAINQYFSTWSNAIYALNSQPAIAQLALVLGADGAAGLPRLTGSSLLAAVVDNYGLDAAVDAALISILPTGRFATTLDTNVTYYSTQLAALLAQLLGELSDDFGSGLFGFMAAQGQMMAYTGESLARLEAGLAETMVAGASTDANVGADGPHRV